MDDVLMDKGMNTPWQLTLREAAIFMDQTGAESMVVGMKFLSGKTLRIKVTVADRHSQQYRQPAPLGGLVRGWRSGPDEQPKGEKYEGNLGRSAVHRAGDG